MTAPLLVDIKSNALDDGPGIRSVVFFKGCPLSCVWCHNPESLSRNAELSVDPSLCVSAGYCAPRCPEGAIRTDGGVRVDRARCTRCFECTTSCPSGALSRVGEAVSPEALTARLLRDKPFYDHSGGGVTLSGGEPTGNMEYLGDVAQRLKKAGVHTLLQTCGAFNLPRFETLLYPWLDLIYYDIKLIDAAEHAASCGADNTRILENFAHLQARARDGGVPILPRVPLIPDITDRPENLAGIARWLQRLSATRVQLVPYNPLWSEKHSRLGHSPRGGPPLRKWMPAEHVARCEAVFTAASIQTVSEAPSCS